MKKTESIRQRQVASTIQRNFSIVLQQQGSYIYGSTLVTVTNVQVTPDLAEAKIYLSIFNTEEKQSVLLLLNSNLALLRKELAIRIRKQVRRIPEISLFEDDTLDEMFRLNKLFDDLVETKQMPKDDQTSSEEE